VVAIATSVGMTATLSGKIYHFQLPPTLVIIFQNFYFVFISLPSEKKYSRARLAHQFRFFFIFFHSARNASDSHGSNSPESENELHNIWEPGKSRNNNNRQSKTERETDLNVYQKRAQNEIGCHRNCFCFCSNYKRI